MAEVSGGGSVAVADDVLFEHADRHEAFSAAAQDLLLRLRRIDTLVSARDATRAGLAAEYAIDDAIQALHEAGGRALFLATCLRSAAVAYGIAERTAEAAADARDGVVAYFLGIGIRPALPFLAAAGWALGQLAKTGVFDGAKDWFTEHSGVYTNRIVGDAVEGIANGSDEFIAGMFGVPLGLVPLLGGLRYSARTLVGVGGMFGALGDTPVQIAKQIEGPSPAPPESLSDLGDRVKQMEDDGVQILVENYELMGGGRVATVYVDGTIDWSLFATDQPFDMSANVNGVAELDNAGYQSLRKVLLDQGLDDGTPVQLIGFSQGALHAVTLAKTGEFNVQTLVTVGSPGGHIEVDSTIRGIAIGHVEDPVHRLRPEPVGGQVYWQSEAFPATPPTPADGPVPAHQFPPYLRDLALIDESGARIVSDEVDRIVRMTDGAVRTSSTGYVVERIPAKECIPAEQN